MHRFKYVQQTGEYGPTPWPAYLLHSVIAHEKPLAFYYRLVEFFLYFLTGWGWRLYDSCCQHFREPQLQSLTSPDVHTKYCAYVILQKIVRDGDYGHSTGVFGDWPQKTDS